MALKQDFIDVVSWRLAWFDSMRLHLLRSYFLNRLIYWSFWDYQYWL